MHKMALSDPASPPLAELLRGVPQFVSLPEESNACLAHLRGATLERYAPGEPVHVGGDLLVISAGEISIASIASQPAVMALYPGAVFDERRLGVVRHAALRAVEPTLILRFDADSVSVMPLVCPGIAAVLIASQPIAVQEQPIFGNERSTGFQ